MKFILSRQILFGVTPKIPQRNKCNTSEEAKSLHLQKPKKNKKKTRMHSSRMRTARLWPVSPGMHFSRGGVPGPGSVPGPGRCTWSRGGVPGPRGVYLVPGGCTWSQGVYLVPGECTCPGTPPRDRITDACENITLPQLRCGR